MAIIEASEFKSKVCVTPRIPSRPTIIVTDELWYFIRLSKGGESKSDFRSERPYPTFARRCASVDGRNFGQRREVKRQIFLSDLKGE